MTDDVDGFGEREFWREGGSRALSAMESDPSSTTTTGSQSPETVARIAPAKIGAPNSLTSTAESLDASSIMTFDCVSVCSISWTPLTFSDSSPSCAICVSNKEAFTANANNRSSSFAISCIITPSSDSLFLLLRPFP